MMEARRKSLSDVPESGVFLPSILERSPLLDRRALRSWSTSSLTGSNSSVSVFQLHNNNKQPKATRPHTNNLKTIAERPSSISRSRSDRYYGTSPYSYRSTPVDHAQFRSKSPQYRVNPVVVRFDERLLPERMNYGIAGYNTSRNVKRGVPMRSSRTRSVPFFRMWTRRLRVRLIRIRVRSACSRLMMRFRRRR